MMPLLQFITRIFINIRILRGAMYLGMTLGKRIYAIITTEACTIYYSC